MPRERKTETHTFRFTKPVKMYINRNKETSEKIHEFLEKLLKKEKVKKDCDHYFSRKRNGDLMPCEFCGKTKEQLLINLK